MANITNGVLINVQKISIFQSEFGVAKANDMGLDPANFNIAYADVDGSGSIDIVDALLIAQYYVGLITEFPGQSQTPAPTTVPLPPSSYDNYILEDSPVAYWTLVPGAVRDISGNNINGTFVGNPSSSTLPNGNTVSVFNGLDQYFEIPDNPLLEITRTGIVTIEAWMRPDVLNFQIASGTGPYVHWMGKGEPGQHAWAARVSMTTIRTVPTG